MRNFYVRTTSAGFAMVEVLVTLLILAGGLLAVGKFQGTLIENSSLAKQRTEAVMLGQQKIESLRAYEVLTTTTGKFAYADIATGADTVNGTNATYARSWAVAASSSPAYKRIAMTVGWTDNRGGAQSVSLATLVSSSDPALSGSLIAIAGGHDQPYGRNLSIPTTATNNGDGTSTYLPPGSSGVSLVYNNATGQISGITSGGVTQGVTAQSISGYISLGSGSDSPHTALSAINASVATISGTSYGCWDNSTTATYPGYATYTCAMSTGWSGSIILSGFVIGESTGADKVCRYYKTDSVGHPYAYANVTASLTSQNYIAIRGNNPCVSGTVLHQQ